MILVDYRNSIESLSLFHPDDGVYEQGIVLYGMKIHATRPTVSFLRQGKILGLAPQE